MADAAAREEASWREADADWWRGAVIYQIYPRSFNDVVARTTKDSKVPGAGDIRVVQESVGTKESVK